MTEVTYLGTVHGTMAALRRMRPRDAGAIVQVGSALAYRGIPLQSAYCGAKHAIQGFTESLRCELLHEGSGARDDGPDAGVEHTSVRLEPHKMPPAPAGAADLPAGGRRRAIVWASRHRRKEIDVGWPTVKAIVGDKIASSLADHYLARKGYEAQLTDRHANPAMPDNLFEPCDLHRDAGAHGRFDSTAKSRSAQAGMTENRGLIRVGAAAGVVGLVATLTQLRLRGG